MHVAYARALECARRARSVAEMCYESAHGNGAPDRVRPGRTRGPFRALRRRRRGAVVLRGISIHAVVEAHRTERDSVDDLRLLPKRPGNYRLRAQIHNLSATYNLYSVRVVVIVDDCVMGKCHQQAEGWPTSLARHREISRRHSSPTN